MMAASGVLGATAPAWSKGCGVCRRSYPPKAWNDLPVVERLPATAVQPHLSVPADWIVELRRCNCGALLAARAI